MSRPRLGIAHVPRNISPARPPGGDGDCASGMESFQKTLQIATWKHNNISNELIFLGVTTDGELLPHGLFILHRFGSVRFSSVRFGAGAVRVRARVGRIWGELNQNLWIVCPRGVRLCYRGR